MAQRLLTGLLLLLWAGNPALRAQQILVLEDFEQDEPGSLPSRWFNRDGNHRPAGYESERRQQYQYEIVLEDGNRFLRYNGTRAKHLMQPLKARHIDLSRQPVLSWRWRANQLPATRGNEEERLNDAALSVYVVFEMTRLNQPRVIRYTWASGGRAGEIQSRNFGHQKIMVLQAGAGRTGEWILESRDLAADYRRVFRGDPPKEPLGLLILSDGDDFHHPASGDYDDFLITFLKER